MEHIVSDVAGKVASVGRNVEGFKEGDNVVTVLPTRVSIFHVDVLFD